MSYGQDDIQNMFSNLFGQDSFDMKNNTFHMGDNNEPESYSEQELECMDKIFTLVKSFGIVSLFRMKSGEFKLVDTKTQETIDYFDDLYEAKRTAIFHVMG